MIRNKLYFNSTTPTALIVIATGVVFMIATASIFTTTITTTTLFRSIILKDDDRKRKKKKKMNNKNILRRNYDDDDEIESDNEVENYHHDDSIDKNNNSNNDIDTNQEEKNAYEQLIGNTPFILLNNLSKLINRNIYVKMECYNPSGTGKDRAAYHMIHIAEITNQLPKPIPIIEMTQKQQQSVTSSSTSSSSSSSSLPIISSSTNSTNGYHHNMKTINDEQNDNQEQQTHQESMENEDSNDIDNSPMKSGTSIVKSLTNDDIKSNNENNNKNIQIKQQNTKQQRQKQQNQQKMEDNLIIYHQLIRDAMAYSRTGGLVIEGSSGSTGIAVANQCYYKGHGCIIILPDDQSYEKANIISQLFHAVIHIVPTASISNPYHYLNISKRIYQIASCTNNIKAVFLNQFENLANYHIHYEQTGPEIYQQFHHEIMKKKKKNNMKNNMKNKDNDQLDAFVMSAGTGGTISGIGQYLKERIPNIQIILIDPPGSILYNKILYNVGYTIQQSERDLKRHRYDTIVEGIGLDRITANIAIGLKEDDEFEEDFEIEENNDNCTKKREHRRKIIDTAIQVTDQDCIDMAHYILQLEGILIGSSSSMNIVGAIETAGTLPYNSNIITIICDTGYRHISRFYNPTFIQSKDLIWPTTITTSSTSSITPIATSTISSTTSASIINNISEISQQKKHQDQSSSTSHHKDDSVSSSSLSSTIRIPRCIQAILAKEQTNNN